MTEKEFNQISRTEVLLESKAMEADLRISSLQEENNKLKTGFYKSPFVDELVNSNDRLKIQLGERDSLIEELKNTIGKLFEVKTRLEVDLATEKKTNASFLDMVKRLRERIEELGDDLESKDQLIALKERISQCLTEEKEELKVKVASLTSGNEWFAAELQRVNEQSLEFLKDRKTLRGMVGILMKEIEHNEQQLR